MSNFRSSRAWDDMQVTISAARVPASSAPQWTTYNFGIGGGVAFAVLGFGVNEYLDFYVQTSHSMELNSILDNHIHWTVPRNSAGAKFKFQLDVIAAGVDAAFAVPAGSPYSAEVTLGAAEAGYHRLLELAEIPASNTTVSSIYICRLTRIAASSNEYGRDVYVIFDDSHYMKDSVGSITEYTK
jgi:hypothetical protein